LIELIDSAILTNIRHGIIQADYYKLSLSVSITGYLLKIDHWLTSAAQR